MTTTLPPCPLCGMAATLTIGLGYVTCPSAACAMNWHATKTAWLALCARITPAGHVAVPESEIEALKSRVIQGRGTGIETCTIAPSLLDAIIARLPRKADHAETLERMSQQLLDPEWRKLLAKTGPSRNELAALKAAIVRMRESNP